MPSLLVTRKMSPELAARVLASVRGRRAAPGARLRPRSLSLLRLVSLAIVIAGTTWLVQAHGRAARRLEARRSELLARVQRETGSLDARAKRLPERVQPWLERCAGSYAGDWVAGELRVPGAPASILSRPTVYVRGPLTAFSSPAGVASSASSSFKDAFVLCLVQPPAARTEPQLLARTRSAYAGGKRMREATRHVERLHDALIGLGFLNTDFEARVRSAADERELDGLRSLLERTPLEAAKRAARAALLLFAIDEPADGPGPTELDGERARQVRVGLVDLSADKLLLRLRRRVDPGWLTAATRAEYASGVDGCTLAFDVRAALGALD